MLQNFWESISNGCAEKLRLNSCPFKVSLCSKPYVYWTVHHCENWRMKGLIDITIYQVLFHFFCSQHVSDINTVIPRLTSDPANEVFFRWFLDSANEYGFG